MQTDASHHTTGVRAGPRRAAGQGFFSRGKSWIEVRFTSGRHGAKPASGWAAVAHPPPLVPAGGRCPRLPPPPPSRYFHGPFFTRAIATTLLTRFGVFGLGRHLAGTDTDTPTSSTDRKRPAWCWCVCLWPRSGAGWSLPPDQVHGLVWPCRVLAGQPLTVTCPTCAGGLARGRAGGLHAGGGCAGC